MVQHLLTLGVKNFVAGSEEVKAAYRGKALNLHPDRCIATVVVCWDLRVWGRDFAGGVGVGGGDAACLLFVALSKPFFALAPALGTKDFLRITLFSSTLSPSLFPGVLPKGMSKSSRRWRSRTPGWATTTSENAVGSTPFTYIFRVVSQLFSAWKLSLCCSWGPPRLSGAPSHLSSTPSAPLSAVVFG